MSKQHYVVNCYTCQHNGQETCKGCNTLLVGENEPYENWQLREDLETKDQRIAELEEQLKGCIRPKFKPNEDLFVIVGYKDETKSIEQYYIDEIVIRGNGKLIEYRDIEQEMVIGENNLLFATYEEAQAKLEEVENGSL